MTETTETENLLLGYFPLWGATLNTEEVGWLAEALSVYIPDVEVWRKIQKYDVWMERYLANPHTHKEAYSLTGPQPPVCLVIGEALHPGEDAEQGFNRLSRTFINSARDGVLALRLWKEGWFLDPELSEQIFSAGFYNFRWVGPYRQAFLGGVPTENYAGYSIALSELITPANEFSPISLIWELIQSYKEGKMNASADIAIENFHRSYGYQLLDTQKAAFLFIALDAILGGMSAHRIGKLKLNTSFKDRVIAALQVQSFQEFETNMEPSAEAEWLDTQGRSLRNALAHGRPYEVKQKAQAGFSRLQAIVRVLLRQYLIFCVYYGYESEDICYELDISAASGPVAAYNQVLQKLANGENAFSDLLEFHTQ